MFVQSSVGLTRRLAISCLADSHHDAQKLQLKPNVAVAAELAFGQMIGLGSRCAMIGPGCGHEEAAPLIRTGQERYDVDDPQFFNQPGMSRAGTLHLIDQGARILGTDGLGWDLPFGVMAKRYRETGDKTVLWDGHKAIVEREGFIVQQLTNLGALPLRGFMVGCFPIKLARCSAAPARVVGFLNEERST